VAMLTLLSKSLALARSTVWLVRGGFDEEAFGLSHSLLELAMTMRYITNGRNPEVRAKRFVHFVLDNFKQAVMVDRQTFITDDGATVFVEGRGDLILKQTGQPYRNIYVFRFSISDGKITEIREYANPVIYAKALGLKVG
jgi:Phenazine biosynthesis protein A/B